jgi:hypothetical protein
MRLGMSHAQTTIILAVVQLVYIGMALLFFKTTDRYLLSAVVGLSILLSIILDRLILKKLAVKEPSEENV